MMFSVFDPAARCYNPWITLDPVADENTMQMHNRIQFKQVFGI